MQKQHENQYGFTLFELMIVIVSVVLLALMTIFITTN